MEAERPVADDGHHVALRPGQLRRARHGQGAADRSGEPVDETDLGLESRLGPLPELTAVGDEDGPAVEEGLERRAHAQRVHRPARRAAQRVPACGLGPARRRHLLAPARGDATSWPRAASCSRSTASAGSASTAVTTRPPGRRAEASASICAKRQSAANAGGLAEAHREVEPLAEEQHDVGLGQPGRGQVQPRIVHAARTLHRAAPGSP